MGCYILTNFADSILSDNMFKYRDVFAYKNTNFVKEFDENISTFPVKGSCTGLHPELDIFLFSYY